MHGGGKEPACQANKAFFQLKGAFCIPLTSAGVFMLLSLQSPNEGSACVAFSSGTLMDWLSFIKAPVCYLAQPH